MKRKIVAAMMAAVMSVGLLAGCGNEADSKSANNKESDSGNEADSGDQKDSGDSEDAGDSGDDGGTVTLKLFSNLPDRKNGQGLVEQTIIDEYMNENKNVKIEVEALDEEAYKTKFKAYAMDDMPDVVSIWGQPAFLDEVLEAGVLAELDESDYADYDFVEGSLDGFKKDGKLYGLPRNTDIAVFYYNQKMFEDNNWEVPATYDDLLALADDINAKGIIPVAMDGGDGWPMAVYLTDLAYRLEGSAVADKISSAVAAGDFTDDVFKKATQLLVDSAAKGLFQTGYDSQDYGTAMNLFTNGQAAMFYMGTWETSMATNKDIPEDIRTNIRVFVMPAVEGSSVSQTDLAAWNGGGYAISQGSKNKEEAVKFLNYMYQPDKLSKYGWENGVGLSAQDQTAYTTGKETELQKQVMDLLTNATSMSGTPINDCGPSEFKTVIESEIQNVSNGTTSVDDFLSTIGAACK